MTDMTYVPITSAGRLFPHPPGRSTLARYVSRGLRGTRLRVVRSAGRCLTTQQWVDDFLVATSDLQRTQGSASVSNHTKNTISPTPISASQRLAAVSAVSCAEL